MKTKTKDLRARCEKRQDQREIPYESLSEFFERVLSIRIYDWEVSNGVFYGLIYNIWDDSFGVWVIPYKEDVYDFYSNIEYTRYPYSVNPPYYECPDRFLNKLKPVTSGGNHWVNECRRLNKLKEETLCFMKK